MRFFLAGIIAMFIFIIAWQELGPLGSQCRAHGGKYYLIGGDCVRFVTVKVKY